MNESMGRRGVARWVTWMAVLLIGTLALAGCATSAPAYSLTGVEWNWQNWTTGGETTVVPDPENYTLNFNTDGTVAGQADCNRFAGTYTTEQNGIQIQLGPTTLAACEPGSLSDTYLAVLGQVVAGGNDGNDNLALETGGGATRMIFSTDDVVEAAAGGFLGLPWWLWLLGLLALGALLWWLASRNRPQPAPAAPVKRPAAPPAPQQKVKVQEMPADDLTRIEGIGPKISSVLVAAGISTFLKLSNTSVDELSRILTDAGLSGSYGDPTTWPEQAKLAAAGDWTALEAMQANLKGGRIS